jgi:low affinity Fe/Cu permease
MKPNQQIQRVALAITRWIGSPLSIVIHTLLFILAITILVKGIFSFDVVILILNTAVSLEAIYLALFIQMTVNYQAESIEEVAEDVEEMQEDIGEIQEDVDELQEDVEDISEDVEEITEEEAADQAEEEVRKNEQRKTLVDIQSDLRKLMQDIQRLQKN